MSRIFWGFWGFTGGLEATARTKRAAAGARSSMKRRLEPLGDARKGEEGWPAHPEYAETVGVTGEAMKARQLLAGARYCRRWNLEPSVVLGGSWRELERGNDEDIDPGPSGHGGVAGKRQWPRACTRGGDAELRVRRDFDVLAQERNREWREKGEGELGVSVARR
jgi:hypothetical protein